MNTDIPDCDTSHAFGWVRSEPEVSRVLDAWEARGMPATFAAAAPHLMTEGSDDVPVFFWQAEAEVLGRILPTWNQGSIGSCVSHGWGRGVQDLLLTEIAAGEAERWPGAEVNRETIYGGSRVEVGGGRIRGDGSVGAWAAEFVRRWGVLVNQRYDVGGQVYDLSGGYDTDRCRQWGQRGVPDPLEPVTRLHSVGACALVASKEEGWAAMGAGKPVVVCSDQGFDGPRDKDGYCPPVGVWPHSMATRARFVHPRRGRSVVLGNSWGDYLGERYSRVDYLNAQGATRQFELPPGHFCTTWTVWGGMLAQRDSFAPAGFAGWKLVRPSYTS